MNELSYEKKKITYVSLLADESIHGEFEKALKMTELGLGQHHPMYIGDETVYSGEEFEVRSPIDQRILIGFFQKGGDDEARRAIQESKSAFHDWGCRDWRERTAILRGVGEMMDREKFNLAALITYEVGKNRYEALAEVSEAIDFFRYYTEIYERNQGYIRPMSSDIPGERCRSVMRPHGVWAVISPFNFPIALAAGMCAGALLTGNTVVLKPTSEAPLSGLRLYQLLVSSGVPPGVINVVTGPGKPFGDAIVTSQDVDGIAFTGSRDVGMWLHRSFAAIQPYAKPVISELGSKNPCIVTAKADLKKAVEGVVKAAFGYSGQKCSATSRVYVHASIAADFRSALRLRTEELTIGDPRDRDVFMGPLINTAALNKFRDAVETVRRIAEGEGGIVTGGKVCEDGPLAKGFYATPTVVTNLPRGHRLLRDELFVPFLIVDTYSTLDEALAQANNTEYGLTAGIFSEDSSEIEFFFEHIRFGVCYANREGGATTGAWPGAQPFGGWKASGTTGRGVGGPYYLLSYLREQAQTRVV
jgi:1-pyrroline-5-carboxylate dehydrogenase